jgi:hypothetical protein
MDVVVIKSHLVQEKFYLDISFMSENYTRKNFCVIYSPFDDDFFTDAALCGGLLTLESALIQR